MTKIKTIRKIEDIKGMRKYRPIRVENEYGSWDGIFLAEINLELYRGLFASPVNSCGDDFKINTVFGDNGMACVLEGNLLLRESKEYKHCVAKFQKYFGLEKTAKAA